MGLSKITRNFQVTLPKDVREIKNLNVGDKVLFSLEDGKIDIVKVGKNAILEVAGLWSGVKETGVEYERRVRRGWHGRSA
jgi:antitoxin PrlF